MGTMYLQAEKDGQATTQLLLRPDEIAAIAWVASGALWSWSMDLVSEKTRESGNDADRPQLGMRPCVYCGKLNPPDAITCGGSRDDENTD